MSVIFYHRTHKNCLASIRREGLVAQCGEACVGLNKHRVGVYLWHHRAAAEGNPFGGRRRLRGDVVIAVEIPDTYLFLLRRDCEYFEDETEAWVYPIDIPVNWLNVLS